jgi:SanA protein
MSTFGVKKEFQKHTKTKIMNKWIKLATATTFTILVAITIIANQKVDSATANDIYNDAAKVPANRVGLLLGTSKTLSNGKPNQYFTYRIDAVVQLINARKIKYVVISGDNSKHNYNEPQDMKEALMQRGLPENRIYLDYAGFRTYDSVYRMQAIFGQTDFTIISQEFHNRRAVYIAQTLYLHAVGFNARNVTKFYGFKTNIREKFSRVKMFIDLAFNKKPKFLGEQIKIL